MNGFNGDRVFSTLAKVATYIISHHEIIRPVTNHVYTVCL